MGVKKPAWVTYGKGGEWWSIIHHKLAFDVGYETRGIKRYEFHIFPNAKDCDAVFKRHVAAWKAAGFVKLTPAEFEAMPQQGDGTSAYLGWTGPFPEDARYYRAGKAICAVAVRGDVVIVSGGTIGRDFGELEKHHYGASAKGLAEQYEQSPKFYKPITREQLVELYRTAKAKTKTKKATKPKRRS